MTPKMEQPRKLILVSNSLIVTDPGEHFLKIKTKLMLCQTKQNYLIRKQLTNPNIPLSCDL